VVLSLLVSADRVLNVLKFGFIKLRAKLTGRLPQDSWSRAPLPSSPHDFPMVRPALCVRRGGKVGQRPTSALDRLPVHFSKPSLSMP
jgi:hypothetical protein